MKRVVFAVLVLAGCGSKPADDPFTADLKMICNAGANRADLPPDMRSLEAAREIAAKIKTPEAARLMAAVMQAAPEEKAALMAGALKKAGIARCPMLEP